MTNTTKICPTCGQALRRFSDKLIKRLVVGGVLGTIAGILFGIWFSVWWFGEGMHSTPMAIIHYFSWGALFGFAGIIVALMLKR